MINLTIKTELPELQERLVLANEWFGDWRPVFDAFHGAWVDSRRDMYRTGGASLGARWPMYSKSTNELQYAAVKSKILGHRMTRKDLLRWLGGDERLFPSFVDSDDPNHVYQTRGQSMTVGSRLDYAAQQDAGTGTMPDWAGGQKIPRRRMLKFGQGFERAISSIVSNWAAEGALVTDEGGKQRAGMSTAQVQDLISRGS